jgi:predicted phosphodiesterase
VNERFKQSMEWNDLHEPKELTINKDSYHILIAGDSHVGGTNNLNQFFEAGIENGAVMMAIAGDVTTGREEDYDVLVSELSSVDNMPVCLVPGNHDLYFNGWYTFRQYFGTSFYTFKVNTKEATDCYIFLDTAGGTLGTDQLDWLKNMLDVEREQYRHVVVITHVNFFRNRFTNSTNILNEEIVLLLDLFEKYQIDIIIQGHDHKRYEEIFGHTTYITLDALLDGYKYASFLELSIEGEQVSYRFIDI